MSKAENAKNLPVHIVYGVTEKEGEEATWAEVGATWRHKDGRGLNLTFKALPLPGARIVLREPKSDEDDT